MDVLEIESEVPEPVRVAIASTPYPTFVPVATSIITPENAMGEIVILARRAQPYFDLVIAGLNLRRTVYVSFEDQAMADEFVRITRAVGL